MVRAGYKRTEVGDIPEDWNVVPLLSLARIAMGQVDPKVDPYRSMTLVAPDHIESATGRLLSTATAAEQRAISGKYLFSKGDVIYSKIRPYLRKAILAPFDGLCSADMYPLKPAQGVAAGLLLAILLSNHFTNYAVSVSVRSGMPKINRAELADYSTAVPPSAAEQTGIADALHAADDLIESLEHLLAKKRAIKQGAMQSLLTGANRLPGFTEPWRTIPFGELARPRRDRVDPSHSETSSFCIELEHIQPTTGRLLGASATHSGASLKSVFRPGDVLFGKLRAYLRKYWLADRHGLCSTEIWVLAPVAEAVTSQFLFQLVTTNDFVEAASTAYGTHMPRSDWRVVAGLQISVPSPPEQAAIAEVLADLDADLVATTAKLDKARALKQGMMQELLTGRIRLV
ncbi:MAG: restriction endonuclease subunit S [Planctomycetes bacterium]|jgi:type I restriction enzyme S subunit|nr:restriction endonuclease subunit S [Planctomycetota bacterium]